LGIGLGLETAGLIIVVVIVRRAER
jgi:hypothetical protein